MNTKTTKPAGARRVRDDYLDLIRRFPLKAIRNEEDFNAALAVIENLAVIGEEALTPGQADYLSALTDLVERYDREHHRMDLSDIDGIDALRYLVAENRMTPSDLGRLLGNRRLGSKILNGKRQMSKAHVKALCERFKVHADLFLGIE